MDEMKDPITLDFTATQAPAEDAPVGQKALDSERPPVRVVLLALDDVKAGSMPEEQKKAMVQGITQNNAQITFEALMSNLRKAAKIKVGDALEQQ